VLLESDTGVSVPGKGRKYNREVQIPCNLNIALCCILLYIYV
jgi:hypothetical protein